MKSILLVKKFLGLVEMTSGLVNASFSLPEWQAVKMIFFAPKRGIPEYPEIHLSEQGRKPTINLTHIIWHRCCDFSLGHISER